MYYKLYMPAMQETPVLFLGREDPLAKDMEINPVSVFSSAIIFSHSEGCLFTLLIVSFSVQNPLSLIRSHLFTFVFISVTSLVA